MIDKRKGDSKLIQNMATSIVVTESRKITQTSTTVSTVQAYKKTECRSTSLSSANPGSSNSLAPVSNFSRLTGGRSSYHAPISPAPLTTYRSAFNNAPMASYRSCNSKAKYSSMEKTDKNPKEKDKTKNDNEKKPQKEKENDTKNSNNKIVDVTDARLAVPLPNLNNNSYNGQYFNPDDMDKKLIIKVVKCKKFLPTQEDKVPTYSTKSRHSRGKVLVINNINFPNKRRVGAHVDHENINKLFRSMGFTIEGHCDKNGEDMKKIITDYCKDSSLMNADINVTVIMSHGTQEENKTHIEALDNQNIEADWIVDQFSNAKCKYLAGKPKIFIFQCCRGGNRDIIQTDGKPFQAPRTHADMLLAYATVPDFVSHRDPKLGTWYIQAICKIFMEHAHDTDVENLLKIVDANLTKNDSNHRQTSSYENRGFKRCYLNPIP